MNSFMKAQKKHIEHDKWLEGNRIERDPGVEFIMDWIENNATKFRESWENSLCKICFYTNDCGYKVKPVCEKYQKLTG